MAFQNSGDIRYFTFDLFQGYPIIHGLYTRHGGVSPAPFASLNHGGTVGDARPNVVENRRRVFAAMNRPVESIYDVWQVHGTRVICTNSPRPLDAEHVKADAILTNVPEVTLFMRFADCVPVMLYDPVHQVVGIAHAGWRGTVDQIAAVTVERMCEVYGTRPADVLAGIGPSICVDHYEVGPEVIAAARESFGSEAERVIVRRNGATHLDLWEANRLVLERSGVRQIEIAELCTACHLEDWYSHRGENGKTGRFGALICLNQTEK